MPAWPAATARGVDSGCGRFRTPTHIRKGVGAERPARRRRRDRHRLGGGAQQRDVRMERQRALMAAVAGGLRTQQLGQLQQPARRAAGAEPDHAGARPMAGSSSRMLKPGCTMRPASLRSASSFCAVTSPRNASVRCKLAATTGRPASGANASARQRITCCCRASGKDRAKNRRRRWTWGLGK